MSQVQQLYRLQQYDSEIFAKKRRLSEVVQLQRETAELLAVRKRVRDGSAVVSTWTATLTDLSLELGSISDKAKRSEERMYSGKVTNTKELEDLQKEVEALGRRRANLEDETLEAMITLEDAQAELDDAKQNHRRIESAWEASQASLLEEQNQLALELHGLISERETYKERIEPRLLDEYESIRVRKNGIGVVPLVNNSCTGCHVGVSANIVLAAERGERVLCNGCGRLLFMP